MTKTTTTKHISAEQLFRRFLDHLLSDPGEPIDEDLWAPEVVIEVPFASGGVRRIEGRSQFLALAEEGRRALSVRRGPKRRGPSNRRPGRRHREYELAGTLTTTSQHASERFVGVLTAGNGWIVHRREYQDTLAMLTALGPQSA
jgi:uncharacterized protein